LRIGRHHQADPPKAKALLVPFEVNKTELVWPGKYDEEGNLVQPPRVLLPFQVIERVNETRATREAKKAEGLTLFDVWDGSKEGSSFEDGWRNKLIWGDNLVVLGSLAVQFAGQFQLIYVDPPFAMGADFTMKIEIGDYAEKLEKGRSLLEEVAYRDTWGGGLGTYLAMMHQRLTLIRDMLCDNGSLYVHLDATAGHYVKAILDDVFGARSFQREIVWRIGWVSGYKSAARNWIRNHDVILFYTKNPDSFTFNKEYIPYPTDYKRRDGKAPEGTGYPIEDVWNANEMEFGLTGDESLDSIQIKSFSREKTGYPTQKNESLMRRMIRASSNEGELVGDFFAGSGSFLAAAEKLGRRWIGVDLGRFAVHTTRKRLLEIENCKPFEVLNLGSYERQFWSTSNFGHDLDGDGKVNLLEYIAFILKLYGGEPIAGSAHLHGRKGDAYVYIGAVSNPVTISEIEQALNECKKMKGAAVHVLGWEWEMGLPGPIEGEATRLGVELTLKQIPREVMEAEEVRKGQIKFFDLAYLKVDLQQESNENVVCTLSDFSTPNLDLISDEVRQKITKWSDYVDYWAVDWDFQNDTFNHGFVSYRTRQDRTLALKSDPHTYPKAGTYRVMIKVIDIFGNDTSKLVELKVKG
jgi:DNA modification methylase